MKPIAPIRPSPIAGTWYEGRPEFLAAEVDRYISEAQLPEFSGDVIAVIAPHAGYRYSGAVAGYAFAAVRAREFDLVAVISPMHQLYQEAMLTSAHEAYATPLGNILIDRAALEEIDSELKENLGFGLSSVANDQEHSLEIELPFLQRALDSDFQLLPIMVRAQELSATQALGDALAKTLRGRNALLVASTDLSHFYTQENANTFDNEMLRQMESFSPEGVIKAEQSGKGFACGRGAVAAVLHAARGLGADTVKVLNYATSGDVTGDLSSVVGYGAAVVYKKR